MRRRFATQITANAAISACDVGGRSSLALGVLHRMQQLHVEADVVSFNAALSAAKSGAWPGAVELLAAARRQGIRLDQVSVGSAVNALSGAWRVALLAAQGASNGHVESAELKGLAKESLWRRALAAEKGSQVSYGAAANVCAAACRWQEVQERAQASKKHARAVGASALL